MKQVLHLIFATLVLPILWGCEKSETSAPQIYASITLAGGSGSEQITIKKGESVNYKFTISSPDITLKKVELWRYDGRGINKVDPSSPQKVWKTPADPLGNQFEITGNAQNLTNDIQFSVYVEDLNGNYTSKRVSAFLDLMRYNQTLLNADNGNAAEAFLNLESGRALPVAMTISDPAAIDFGYSNIAALPLTGPKANACLISFDEFWKAGIYALNSNNLNPNTTFRKISVMTQATFDNLTSAELSGLFNGGTEMTTPAGMGFTTGKIAPGLLINDMLAVKTKDGRFGLLWVKAVTAANIQLSVIIQNKPVQ